MSRKDLNVSISKKKKKKLLFSFQERGFRKSAMQWWEQRKQENKNVKPGTAWHS